MKYYNEFKNIRSLGRILLLKEAIARRIKIKNLNKEQEDLAFFELSYKNHFEYYSDGNVSKILVVTKHCTENKYLSKILLKRKNISVSKGKVFNIKNISTSDKFIKEIGFPLVVKKHNGAFGELVFVDIKNKVEFKKAIDKIFEKNKYVLIEEMFFGTEYRLFATRSKFIAATNRIPANVIGDGIHAIKDLIAVKNSDPKRGVNFSKALMKIKIDDNLLNNLKRQKFKLDSVVKKGEIIYLRNTSNLSTGGDSIDITDQVHPEIKKIAIRAVKAIPGLDYAGVDFMTNKNISEKPTKNSYVVLEVNSVPMTTMHHFPYQGKSRDIAKEIIDILFPETKGRYIKNK